MPDVVTVFAVPTFLSLNVDDVLAMLTVSPLYIPLDVSVVVALVLPLYTLFALDVVTVICLAVITPLLPLNVLPPLM